MSRRFYLTTAIDYVNGAPHLGHAYEKVCADVIARWRRMAGDDVYYLTGTDEHGVKVQKAAAEGGVSPQAFVDALVPAFREAWDLLEVAPDRFIRTTETDHERAVVALLERIRDRGFLSERTYEGWYCEGCEAFKTDKDLKDGRCPDHPTREPKWLEEQNLFFELTKFREALLAWIAADPGVIEPESRRNEVLGWLQGDLEDLSISRSVDAVSWGIPIPFRPGSVVYVWFDALINYATGAGFGTDDERFAAWWPADLHVIGKDITRFHCVIWPAMLLAAGLPLPRKVFAHGWVLTSGERMSKSSGVGVEPRAMARTYGSDAVRWFLVGEISFGRDGEFQWTRFEEVYNAHLANGYGNLVSRAVSMAISYFDAVPDPQGADEPLLREAAERARAESSLAYDELRLHDAAAAAFRLVTLCNEQIQAREPWKLAKDPERRNELASFLYAVLEAVRVASVLLFPILPRGAAGSWTRLGWSPAGTSPSAAEAAWGGLPPGTRLEKPSPVFPRLDQLLAAQPKEG